MKNIVVIHNPKDLKVYNSWKYWCSKYGHKLFVLNESVLEDSSFDKFLIFNILEESNIEYNQILITNPYTIINPNSPDIFNITKNKLCGCFYDSSYDWLFRNIEIYSKFIFNDFIFPYYEFMDNGMLIINKEHKSLFKNILDFYLSYKDNISKIQNKFNIGTDSPIFNFLAHKNKTEINILPYEWNMQDMSRKEIISPSALDFTKIGWIYQFNFIQNREYWMEKTYKYLYEKLND